MIHLSIVIIVKEEYKSIVPIMIGSIYADNMPRSHQKKMSGSFSWEDAKER
jgi:hypothetical protein